MGVRRAAWVRPDDKPGRPSPWMLHRAYARGPVLDPGPVVAEGDSWFDYPPHRDILDHLVDLYGWRVRRLSRAGDTLENMVLGTGSGSPDDPTTGGAAARTRRGPEGSAGA